jgi:hypothetical protein
MVEQQLLSGMGSYTSLHRFQGNGHMVGLMANSSRLNVVRVNPAQLHSRP